jgi:hypothetical protein
VRLAAKLTGWRIDIHSTQGDSVAEMNEEGTVTISANDEENEENKKEIPEEDEDKEKNDKKTENDEVKDGGEKTEEVSQK